MILRVIDKITGLFVRDDFIFDSTIEIGLDVEPAQGFITPRWVAEEVLDDNGQLLTSGRWVEGGYVMIKNGTVALDKIPKAWREKVLEALNK